MAKASPNRAGGSTPVDSAGSAWEAHGTQRASSPSPRVESTSTNESDSHRMS